MIHLLAFEYFNHHQHFYLNYLSNIYQTPGGRVNAKMVSRSSFRHFSLENSQRNCFLRPDRILGAFQVLHEIKFNLGSKMAIKVGYEAAKDQALVAKLSAASEECEVNMTRMEAIALEMKMGNKDENRGDHSKPESFQVVPNIIAKRKSLLVVNGAQEVQNNIDDADDVKGRVKPLEGSSDGNNELGHQGDDYDVPCPDNIPQLSVVSLLVSIINCSLVHFFNISAYTCV